MAVDFTIKQGARLPSLSDALTHTVADVLTAFDLTGYTVRFVMTHTGTAAEISGAAVVVSAAAGTVRYDWGAADTAVIGTYWGSWEVTEVATGKIAYFPTPGHLLIQVEELLSD